MEWREHFYSLKIEWTGNKGTGTSDYRAYERSHTISAENRPVIPGSSDPAFRGDNKRYSPEELLVASISSCHMLWFLHLCADNGIIVVDYTDHPMGVMIETKNGGGRFKEVTLNPLVTVSEKSMIARLKDMHHKASELCFISNSVNFTIKHHSSSKIRKV